MKTIFAAAMTAALLTTPVASAWAQEQPGDNDYRWNGDRDSDWDPYHHYRHGTAEQREIAENERVYHGSDGRYYCKRSDGTTGLVIGAVGGGLIGHALGGGLLGTLVGAGAGGVVGKHVDQHNDDAHGRYHCE